MHRRIEEMETEEAATPSTRAGRKGGMRHFTSRYVGWVKQTK
jgi:hypothetical protein